MQFIAVLIKNLYLCQRINKLTNKALIKQAHKKMTYFKVVNRETRQAQIFTNDELSTFLVKNKFNDYAISKTLSPKDKAFNDVLDTIAISCFSLAFIVLITNFITNLI